MSKFSVGNHVRLTKLGDPCTDQVGVVESVHREKHWWAYNVQFGNTYMPVAEHHLVLAESADPPAGDYPKGGLLDDPYLGTPDLPPHVTRLLATELRRGKVPEPDPVNRRAEVLRTAESLVNGQRADDYGPPAENFGRVATQWSTQFAAKLTEPLTADEVAIALVHLKLSRLANTPDHADSWIDACGYLALGAEIVEGAA